QPVFGGQALGREHRLSVGLFDEPFAAPESRNRARGGPGHMSLRQGPRPYILSKIPAAPIPPPTHIVTMPYRDWRRFISYSRLVVSLAPVQPRGWPRAIAPPLTLSRSRSIGSA